MTSSSVLEMPPRAQGGNESEEPPMTEEQKRKRDGEDGSESEGGSVQPLPEEAAGE